MDLKAGFVTFRKGHLNVVIEKTKCKRFFLQFGLHEADAAMTFAITHRMAAGMEYYAVLADNRGQFLGHSFLLRLPHK